MYKYMKKAEDFTAPSSADAKKLHLTPVASNYGTSGPVKISYPRFISGQVQRWIPALQSLSIPKNDQPLGGDNIGASIQPSDINAVDSTRSSSVAAYFAPASDRHNLKVIVSALATKINLSKSGAGQVATGVDFLYKGKTFTATASQRVIVSGGSVNTPAILEMSGIGSSTVLRKAGIQTKVDNANVGENLQDHTFTSSVFSLVPGIKTLDSIRNDPAFIAQQMALYKANKPSILDETVPSIGYLTLEQLVGQSDAKKMIDRACKYVGTQARKPYYATLKKQLEFLQRYPNQVSQMEVIGECRFLH
jgi:choline dehydrogenase-like flavoprotein